MNSSKSFLIEHILSSLLQRTIHPLASSLAALAMSDPAGIMRENRKTNCNPCNCKFKVQEFVIWLSLQICDPIQFTNL